MLAHTPDLIRLGRRLLTPTGTQKYRRYQPFKTAFDYVTATALTVVALPLVATLAVIVRLTSKGPAFYRQTRVGKDGKLFEIVKLRTMCVDSEAKTGPVWCKEDDPRITPVGAILRRTHLDELPQLFNVLKGDMSLVGPRPERPHFVEKLKKSIPHYEDRLRVKPGITGLAQVRHRYDETLDDVKRKVAYDLLYIRRMCLMVDLLIMVLTTNKIEIPGSAA